MKHLFSPQGGAVLAATMALRPLLAFDFDGTLVRTDTLHESFLGAMRRNPATLLPLAWLAGIWPEAGWAIAVVTLAALVALALATGAGSGKEADEERARADDRQ